MNIDGQPPPGTRPVELYCREIYWAESKSPAGGRIGVEYTCDVELWDRWIDELPQHNESELIERVELYSASLDWGRNLAPQFLRIMRRTES